MEIILIVMAVIVAALLLGYWLPRRNRSGESAAAAAEPQNQLRWELAQRMEEFMESDCFRLMIQPVLDFQTGTVCGGEVLSRLHHPEQGVIYPDDFLSAVDAAGLYPRFDRYIFHKGCAWLSRSMAEGKELEILTVSFSRKTLSEENIAEVLIRIADQYGLAHGKLAIEIMERERETDARRFSENITRLKESGFSIILDDFGSGVTSVKDLMQYPVDTVKIDRSLLTAADTEQGRAAYRSMTAMAAQLGIAVVCEGIETQEQYHFAREAGCRYGQGYLFYRPTSAEKVFRVMEKNRYHGGFAE